MPTSSNRTVDRLMWSTYDEKMPPKRTESHMRNRQPQTGSLNILSSFKNWYIHMGVSKNRGTPKWMVKIMENPIKMDDLGVPWGYHYFRKHPYVIICRGLQIDPSSLRLGLFFFWNGRNIRFTPPKTNEYPMKINGWKMIFPFEMIPFQVTC